MKRPRPELVPSPAPHCNPPTQHRPASCLPTHLPPLLVLLLVLLVPQPLIHILPLLPRLSHLLIKTFCLLFLITRLAACRGASRLGEHGRVRVRTAE